MASMVVPACSAPPRAREAGCASMLCPPLARARHPVERDNVGMQLRLNSPAARFTSRNMKTFDFYEFAALLTPGAVLLYAVSRICPEAAPFIEAKGFTLGDLGLFIMLAYVAGHLVQAFGNLIERAF